MLLFRGQLLTPRHFVKLHTKALNKSYQSRCICLNSCPAYKLTRLHTQVGHLHPIWVLSKGYSILICISRHPRYHLIPFLLLIPFLYWSWTNWFFQVWCGSKFSRTSRWPGMFLLLFFTRFRHSASGQTTGLVVKTTQKTTALVNNRTKKTTALVDRQQR